MKEVFALMEKHGDDGRVMAGGTSLIIMMRQRLLTPKMVISLARLPKFDKISIAPMTACASAPARAIATSSYRKPCSSIIPCSTKPFVKSPNRASVTWARWVAISRPAIHSQTREPV